MNIYEAAVIVTFIIATIILISQYIGANTPKVSDVLQIMNILPCYEIKAYKNGKRLRTNEFVKYINSPVKDYMLKEGILYMEIY